MVGSRRHTRRTGREGHRPEGRPDGHHLAETAVGRLAVFGRHPVAELLRSPRPCAGLLLLEGGEAARGGELEGLARARGVPVRRVGREELERLAGGGNHQGVAALAEGLPVGDEDDLARLAIDPGTTLLVLLDHLQDVGNLGAVLRSAHLCGAQGVVIPRDRAAQPTAAAARASAGAALLVPTFRVVNLARTVEDLKAAGYWVWGLAAEGALEIDRVDLTSRVALVLGGEAGGLSRLVRERCDGLASLPMAGSLGSYNAAVAMGIALYEVLRQRRSQKKR